MRLVRTRPCDGDCCREVPIFPENGKCKYFSEERLPSGGHCRVMNDMTVLQDDEVDKFIGSCKRFPQLYRAGRGTGKCCLQWIDD